MLRCNDRRPRNVKSLPGKDARAARGRQRADVSARGLLPTRCSTLLSEQATLFVPSASHIDVRTCAIQRRSTSTAVLSACTGNVCQLVPTERTPAPPDVAARAPPPASHLHRNKAGLVRRWSAVCYPLLHAPSARSLVLSRVAAPSLGAICCTNALRPAAGTARFAGATSGSRLGAPAAAGHRLRAARRVRLRHGGCHARRGRRRRQRRPGRQRGQWRQWRRRQRCG